MDKIYGFNRLKDTIEKEGNKINADLKRILSSIDAHDKHGEFSYSATNIIDLKAKEVAEKAIVEARKTSKVEEYMDKRTIEKGESDLEYWTGVSGSAYGNVVSTFNLRHDDVFNTGYNALLDVLKELDWSDITPSDVDTILKKVSNSYYASSKNVLNAKDMKDMMTEQNFMCNYAGINTFTSVLISGDLFIDVANSSFKPERISEKAGKAYVYIMNKLKVRIGSLMWEMKDYYRTIRLYETGKLDIHNLTLEDALNLSYRNTVLMSFAVKLVDGITIDSVAQCSEDLDTFLLDEWRKSKADLKYRPKYYVAVMELAYNEMALLNDRLKVGVTLSSDDAPNIKIKYKGNVNFEKLAVKTYHKTHKAISRWILEQFNMDWDSGVYNSKRNGVLITVVDKNKARGVVNL